MVRAATVWNLMSVTFDPAPLPGLTLFHDRLPVVYTTG
jgi:hypothetical protein